MIEYEIIKDSKRLRCGYTTGSCAAAATKAALLMLHTKKELDCIYLMTPKGLSLTLPVLDIKREEQSVSCAIQKDAGDDPDVTDGMYIYAKVTLTQEPKLTLQGGIGIGIVTKPGLDQPIGEAAINSTPRRMILKEVMELNEEYGYLGGVLIEIYAPEGEERAMKTFNSQLGILGGISILGTTGIVEPMSDRAIIDTISIELNQKKEEGKKRILLTPGNYGEDFLINHHEISPTLIVKCSNFIGEAMDFAVEYGFSEVCLVGHIGKLIKIAGGMFNTHSRYGDCRAEIFAAHAAALGLPKQQVEQILQSVTTEEMISVIKQYEQAYSIPLLESLVQQILEKITNQLNRRTNQKLQIELMTFSSKYGLLGYSKGFFAALKAMESE